MGTKPVKVPNKPIERPIQQLPFQYVGCYNDDVNLPMLSRHVGKVNTVDECRREAENINRNVFALSENGKSCYAGKLEECTPDRCFNKLGKGPDE